MNETTSRSSSDFFYQNLSLSGFTNDAAIFMTCKEFIDNGVDAFKKGTVGKFSSVNNNTVELSLDLVGSDNLRITCRDSGIGFSCESVGALGEMFRSSKIHDPGTGGEFGIGLKMIMLWSLKDRGHPLEVCIRVSESKLWRFSLQFNAEKDAPHVSGYKELERPFSEWPWSTEFSIVMSILWDTQLEADLEAYLVAQSFWNPGIKLSFNGIFSGERIFSNLSSNPIDQLIRSFGEEEVVATASCSSEHEGTDIEIVGVVAASSTVETREGEILVLRSCNSMPLLPRDAPTCFLCETFNKFLEEYGEFFGIESAVARKVDYKTNDEKRDVTELRRASYRLHATKSLQSDWSSIVLGIKVRSVKPLFKNLSKTTLADNEGLTPVVFNAIHRIFNQFKSSAPNEFRTSDEIHREKSLTLYAPSIAESITSIICRSTNEEFRRNALNIIGLNNLNTSLLQQNEGGIIPASIQRRKRSRTVAYSDLIKETITNMIRIKLNTENTNKKKNNRRNNNADIKMKDDEDKFDPFFSDDD